MRLQSAFREGEFLDTVHSVGRRITRGITVDDIIEAVGYDQPEIIEEYPSDPRGPSCLVVGVARSQILHVLCTLSEPTKIITCYHPNPAEWTQGFRSRRVSHEMP